MSAINFSISVVNHFTSDASLDVKTIVLKATSDDFVVEKIELEYIEDLVCLRNCINTFLKSNYPDSPEEL